MITERVWPVRVHYPLPQGRRGGRKKVCAGGGGVSLEPPCQTPPFRAPVTGTPDGPPGEGGGGALGPVVPQQRWPKMIPTRR